MAQTTISFRVDSEDKKNFEAFCDNTGMNVSVAMNMFIKAVLKGNRLPFEVSADPFYSASNMKAIDESLAQAEAGETVTKTLAELEAMAE